MKILSIIMYTVVIALVVGVAGLLVGTMLPIPGNIEIKIVKSGSMEPTIATGAMVVVKPASSYAVGDVITFGADTKTQIPTTHRIVAIEGEGAQSIYTTKGDANEDIDPNPTPKSEIIGTVILAIPYVGYILDFARQPIGFMLLIGIPAGLVILEELIAIGRELRRWRGGGKNGGGGGNAKAETFTSHLRLVYARRRVMDEIFVPMQLAPRVFSRGWWHHSLGLGKDSYGISTVLVMGLIFMTSLFAGQDSGTIAYFSDIERTIGNAFRAGTWSPPAPIIEETPVAFAALSGAEGTVLGESDVIPEEKLPAVKDAEEAAAEEGIDVPKETEAVEPTEPEVEAIQESEAIAE